MPVNIALLGPGGDCPGNTAKLAEAAGKALADAGFVTVCGGSGGIYLHALEAASVHGGKTLVINSGEPAKEKISTHMEIFTGTGEAFKHAILANSCSGAILIAGWVGTMAIAFEFLAQKKPVILIEDSGAAASTYADKEIIRGSGLFFKSATDPLSAILEMKRLVCS